MHKTPDEIKTGVEFCTAKIVSGNLKTCDLDCPYRVEGVWCRNALAHDTLEYIERLEDRNAWHDGNEKYLQSFLKEMSKQTEQLEAEKEQLLEDLADHCGSKTLCKKYEDGTCPHEYDCTLYLSTCEDYEWRVLPEV